jgi:hypothetical protein
MLRKLLTRSGWGVSSDTVGLCPVDPPPALMVTQPFASATTVGSPSSTTSPPSTFA